jgi:hypothetical protein
LLTLSLAMKITVACAASLVSRIKVECTFFIQISIQVKDIVHLKGTFTKHSLSSPVLWRIKNLKSTMTTHPGDAATIQWVDLDY